MSVANVFRQGHHRTAQNDDHFLVIYFRNNAAVTIIILCILLLFAEQLYSLKYNTLMDIKLSYAASNNRIVDYNRRALNHKNGYLHQTMGRTLLV